jgi:hypothetical protein
MLNVLGQINLQYNTSGWVFRNLALTVGKKSGTTLASQFAKIYIELGMLITEINHFTSRSAWA